MKATNLLQVGHQYPGTDPEMDGIFHLSKGICLL